MTAPKARPGRNLEFGAFRIVSDGLILSLRVRPGARADAIEGLERDDAGVARLRVRVRAPADKGAANAAVLRLLSRAWRVPVREMSLLRGTASRNKRILISGDGARLARAVTAWLEEHAHER